MGRFTDLLHIRLARFIGIGAEESQRLASTVFPKLVGESRLHLWEPGDPIPRQGRRFLIGAATWSIDDMRFLDGLNAAVARGKMGSDRIDVFNFEDAAGDDEKLARYFPGIAGATLSHPPIVGLWENGVLTRSASGHAGRLLVIACYDVPRDLHQDQRLVARIWRRRFRVGKATGDTSTDDG